MDRLLFIISFVGIIYIKHVEPLDLHTYVCSENEAQISKPVITCPESDKIVITSVGDGSTTFDNVSKCESKYSCDLSHLVEHVQNDTFEITYTCMPASKIYRPYMISTTLFEPEGLLQLTTSHVWRIYTGYPAVSFYYVFGSREVLITVDGRKLVLSTPSSSNISPTQECIPEYNITSYIEISIFNNTENESSPNEEQDRFFLFFHGASSCNDTKIEAAEFPNNILRCDVTESYIDSPDKGNGLQTDDTFDEDKKINKDNVPDETEHQKAAIGAVAAVVAIVIIVCVVVVIVKAYKKRRERERSLLKIPPNLDDNGITLKEFDFEKGYVNVDNTGFSLSDYRLPSPTLEGVSNSGFNTTVDLDDEEDQAIMEEKEILTNEENGSLEEATYESSFEGSLEQLRQEMISITSGDGLSDDSMATRQENLDDTRSMDNIHDLNEVTRQENLDDTRSMDNIHDLNETEDIDPVEENNKADSQTIPYIIIEKDNTPADEINEKLDPNQKNENQSMKDDTDDNTESPPESSGTGSEIVKGATQTENMGVLISDDDEVIDLTAGFSEC